MRDKYSINKICRAVIFRTCDQIRSEIICLQIIPAQIRSHQGQIRWRPPVDGSCWSRGLCVAADYQSQQQTAWASMPTQKPPTGQEPTKSLGLRQFQNCRQCHSPGLVPARSMLQVCLGFKMQTGCPWSCPDGKVSSAVHLRLLEVFLDSGCEVDLPARVIVGGAP